MRHQRAVDPDVERRGIAASRFHLRKTGREAGRYAIFRRRHTGSDWIRGVAQLPTFQKARNPDRRGDQALPGLDETVHEVINIIGDLGRIVADLVGHRTGVGGALRVHQPEANPHSTRVGWVRDKLQIPAERRRTRCGKFTPHDARRAGIGRFHECGARISERTASGAGLEVDIDRHAARRNVDCLVSDGDGACFDRQSVACRSGGAVTVTRFDGEAIVLRLGRRIEGTRQLAGGDVEDHSGRQRAGFETVAQRSRSPRCEDLLAVSLTSHGLRQRPAGGTERYG
ncbi:hypothetical protein D9M70_457170 [compost metagenome]